MARKCSCCNSPDRQSIDAAIRAGESNRAIESQYRVGRSSVQRHRPHLLKMDALSHAPIVVEAQIVTNPVEDLRALKFRALQWLDRAEDAGSAAAAAAWSREVRSIIETMFKMSVVQKEAAVAAALDSPESATLENDPRWLELRAKIFAVLSNYPEAYQALDDFLIDGDLTPEEKRLFAEKPLPSSIKEAIDRLFEDQTNGEA